MMKIGFVGTGIMGKPMASNLMKAGFPLTVYNRTASKCAPLIEAGARLASSPREAAEASDVVITIVSDTPDVESALFADEGVVSGLAPGKIVIDMSTISPEATIDFSRRLAEKGCDMLDAPVSGGERGAVEARLAIMVGGRREAFERCRGVFEALGKTIVHAGPSGYGQKMKLANQIICALNLAAMSEGLRFAELAGLDLDTTLEVVSSGAAGSWMLSNLGPRILQNDYAPGFTIRLQQKDLRLVSETMRSMDERFPASETVYEMFTRAVKEGLGEQGTQGLINLRLKKGEKL